MIRRLRALRAADSGFTLVELVVVVFVSGILLAIVGALFAQLMRVSSDGLAVRKANSQAAVVIGELRRELQSTASVAQSSGMPAYGVVAATSGAITVTSYANATTTAIAPTKVAFATNASGSFVETLTPGVLSGGYYAFTGSSTSRTLCASGDLACTVVFSYTNASGAATTTASSVAAATVSVTIPVSLSTGASTVVLSTTVSMPNLALSGGGS